MEINYEHVRGILELFFIAVDRQLQTEWRLIITALIDGAVPFKFAIATCYVV